MIWDYVLDHGLALRPFYGGDSVFEVIDFGAAPPVVVPELSWQAIYPDMSFSFYPSYMESKSGEEFASPVLPSTTPGIAIIVTAKGLSLSWRVD